MNTTIDYFEERKKDIKVISQSTHPRKVVLAGPGTGKSYLFQEVIKKEREDGKTKFLAITFIGKLTDSLADDLAGLAQTMTLHGFARRFVLGLFPDSKGWEYYPDMAKIILDDLKIVGESDPKIGNDNYKERTKYYKALGNDDVVYYAVQACKKDPNKIPIYDLILIDEFQDFSEIEAEFIDLLATKNKMLLVGDDDQALYKFRGSDPKFIRSKHDSSNNDFESHTLRYCSRCTDVIIQAFHSVTDFYKDIISDRTKKQYLCYYPEKQEDSNLNSKIMVMKDIKIGLIPFKIVDELKKILESQKIKTILIIGEAQSCSSILFSISKKLKELGFKNVNGAKIGSNIFSFKKNVVSGYNILSKGKNDITAWRLLIEELGGKEDIIREHFGSPTNFIKALPREFIKKHEKNSKIFSGILNKPESGRKKIADSSIEKLEAEIVETKKEERQAFMEQLIVEDKRLGRPLANLDITVCNILQSKGLAADVVFLVGFDQGKLPSKSKPIDSEVYQTLVAITRAKKRIYLINTFDQKISNFLEPIKSQAQEM